MDSQFISVNGAKLRPKAQAMAIANILKKRQEHVQEVAMVELEDRCCQGWRWRPASVIWRAWGPKASLFMHMVY